MRVGGDHPACQPASFSHSSLHSGTMTDGRGRKGRGGSRRGGGLQCTRRTHGRRNELPIPFFGSKSRPGVEAKSPQQQRRREELAPGARPPATVRCARAGACHYRRRRRSESVSFRGVCCDGVFRVEPACISCTRNCGKCLHMPSKVTHERAHRSRRKPLPLS